MNDPEQEKKLLKLAAKAAGYDVDFSRELTNGKYLRRIESNVDLGFKIDCTWNPLETDADAFDLAIKLEMITMSVHKTTANTGYASAETPCDLGCVQLYRDHDGDKHKAMRYAIVKLAAKLAQEESRESR
jgi:hypothetical protein